MVRPTRKPGNPGFRVTPSELDRPPSRLASRGDEHEVCSVRIATDQITQCDLLHDRKAKGLYLHISAMIEAGDSEPEIAQYRALQSLLFPDGLRVVRLPYIEEGGAAVAT